MTKYAGPMLPFIVVSNSGRPQPNREIVFLRANDRQPATIYTDRDRSPAPAVRSDAFGNVSGYYAEPGPYIATAGDLPEIEVAATLDNAEIVELAGTTPGPQGPIGPVGPEGEKAPQRFYGDGPPTAEATIGATDGDEYLDRLTGDLYVLRF